MKLAQWWSASAFAGRGCILPDPALDDEPTQGSAVHQRQQERRQRRGRDRRGVEPSGHAVRWGDRSSNSAGLLGGDGSLWQCSSLGTAGVTPGSQGLDDEPTQGSAPYTNANKNDVNDADVIAEASSRPGMRFVGVKSVEQQHLQQVHRARQLAVKD